MKSIITELLKLITIAISVIVAIVVLGLAIPTIISLIVSGLSSSTLNECMTSEPFIGFSILCTFISIFVVGAWLSDNKNIDL